MKIRTKLIIGFAIVASLIWVAVSSARSTYEDIHEEVKMLEEHVVPAVVLLGEMDLAANEANHLSMEYVLYGEAAAGQETLSIIENLKEMELRHGELMKPMGMYMGEEAQAQVEPLSVSIDTFISAIMETNDLKGQGGSTDELLVRDMEIVHPAFVDLTARIGEHKAHHLEALVEAEEAVHEARTSGERFLILVGGLVTLAAVAVSFLITRMITNPLHALHKGAEIIGEGNLDYKVGTPAKDEIGQLSRAFDQMTEDLRGTTTSIDNLNREITERKQAEETLRHSEERFRTIFDTANDGILLADLENQKFYLGNTVICQMLGYSPEEIKNLGVMDIHPEDGLPYVIEQFEKQSREEVTLATDIPVRRKDGSVFYADINSARITLSGRAYMLGTFRDITERKQAEEKIKASLAEKEMLLKEVHHRVKNNMQVISSLLKLQSGFIKNKEDAAMFHESQNRIQSMALVYNKLYQAENLAHIDFREYVKELVSGLAHSYKAVSGKVTTSVEVGDVPLGIDQAIPCGLVINELITNSFKYAFPKGRDGQIRVSIGESEGEVELTVSDDGVGIPASLDLASSPTLGLRLVGNLVEQLGGKIELDRTAGTRFRITFRKSQK